MSLIKRTVSEAIVKSIVKPMQLFNNPIVDGSVFRHTDDVFAKQAQEAREEDAEAPATYDFKQDKDGKIINYVSFDFYCEGLGTFKFSHYDFSKFFDADGEEFGKTFIMKPGEELQFAESFKVVKSTPVPGIYGVDGEAQDKDYPYFAFNGFLEYSKARLDIKRVKENPDLDIVVLTPAEIKENLLASGINPKYADRYNRNIWLEKPIFYYESDVE